MKTHFTSILWLLAFAAAITAACKSRPSLGSLAQAANSQLEWPQTSPLPMPDTSIWRDRLAKCRLINADLSQVDETKLPSGDLLIFKETKAKIEFCLDSLGKNASYRNNPSFYSAVPSLRKSRSDSAQTASVLKAMPEFYQKAKNCIALHEANRGFDKAVAQCLDGLRLLDTIALEMPRMGAHTKTAKTALKDYIAFTKSCAFEFGHRKANVK